MFKTGQAVCAATRTGQTTQALGMCLDVRQEFFWLDVKRISHDLSLRDHVRMYLKYLE